MTRRSPLAPRIYPQHAIPMPSQAQPERETRCLYRAIATLRAGGFTVWRVGGDHLVGRSLLSTRELFKVARTVRRRARA